MECLSLFFLCCLLVLWVFFFFFWIMNAKWLAANELPSHPDPVMVLKMYDGDDTITRAVCAQRSSYRACRVNNMSPWHDFVGAVLFPDESSYVDGDDVVSIHQIMYEQHLRWVPRRCQAWVISALSLLDSAKVVPPVATQPRQKLIVFLEVCGPMIEHVRATIGMGEKRFLLTIDNVDYYLGEVNVGQPVLIPNAVRSCFFNSVIHGDVRGDFKDQAYYDQNVMSYGFWSFYAHRPWVDAVASIASISHRPIVVPGDGIGVFTWAHPNRVKCVGDAVMSTMTHPAIVKESITSTLQRGLLLQDPVLYLGFVGSFLTHEDFLLIAQYSTVVLVDSYLYVPPVAMSFVMRGVWCRGVEVGVAFSKCPIHDRVPHMEIPFSTNLLANAPYMISRPTVITEYIRSMIPSISWSVDTNMSAANLKSMGYNIVAGNNLLLASGVSDAVPDTHYFAPVGKVVNPLRIDTFDGSLSLVTRQLYYTSEGTDLFKLCEASKYGTYVKGRIWFYAIAPTQVSLKMQKLDLAVSLTIVYSEVEEKMSIVQATDHSFVVTRPGLGRTRVLTWHAVVALFAPNTDLSKWEPKQHIRWGTPPIKKKKKTREKVAFFAPWSYWGDQQHYVALRCGQERKVVSTVHVINLIGVLTKEWQPFSNSNGVLATLACLSGFIETRMSGSLILCKWRDDVQLRYPPMTYVSYVSFMYRIGDDCSKCIANMKEAAVLKMLGLRINEFGIVDDYG